MSEVGEDIKTNEEAIPKWFWSVAAAIVIVWFVFYGLNIFIFKLKPNEQGDAFGALNTLFSGFAFLGVIYAILLQRNELKLQRTELEMTREELKGSKEALKDQNKTQEIQRFENTFFNLLNLYSDMLSSVVHGKGEHQVYGRKALSIFATELHDTIYLPMAVEVQDFVDRYESLYKDKKDQLAHYFRNLYRIFVFVDDSKLPEIEKEKYAKIIRSQLSNDELLLLFLNSIDGSKARGSKFRKYIVRYELFNNIDFSFINDTDLQHNLMECYSYKAYGLSK